MKTRKNGQAQEIIFVSAMDLLSGNNNNNNIDNNNNDQPERAEQEEELVAPSAFAPSYRWQKGAGVPAISHLRFPFELKPDQAQAVEAWIGNSCRGSVIYSSGTGKTEIAFECARRVAEMRGNRGRLNIVMLVPRIVLVGQNCARLARYGIPSDAIGRYYGEQKDIQEITICTYQSAIGKPDIVRQADMVILDEVHLANPLSRTYGRIYDVISRETKKALLGLTATIDEDDPKAMLILSIMPPARKYPIRDAVGDGRLAKPVVFPLEVNLTEKEQKNYDEHSRKIRAISGRFKRYNAKGMMELARQGGFPSWQARAWFLNVRRRKALLACAENKLARAAEVIMKEHPGEKVMVFSETLESVRKLRHLLAGHGVPAMIIDGSMQSYRRQKILSEWGRKFYPLLSVHTLEIGFDVPEVGIEIILATTSNMNQIVQRVGRVLRKAEGKESALIYAIYVSDTKDRFTLESIKRAVS
ncbi:MAG TPA: DEAD/DEAH box helicase [Nitrososphaera sp.]|nr:DEAD/DEAH box helicase [Nitrososphaera sp.]